MSSSSLSRSSMAGSESCDAPAPEGAALPTFYDRPTGVDLDLAAFYAEEARNDPVSTAILEECGCAICREALRILGAA